MDNLPALAFDHSQIMDAALSRLKKTIHFKPVGFDMMPELTSYKCVFSSTMKKYGGNSSYKAEYKAEKKSMHGLPFAIAVNIPGNSITIYKPENN